MDQAGEKLVAAGLADVNMDQAGQKFSCSRPS